MFFDNKYVYDNEDIIAEYDGSNVLQATWLHGPGIDEPISMTRGGQTYYYHVDGLGSITELTDSSGAVVRTYKYDAFGNIVEQTGTVVNPFTYTRRELDSESGLYFYRNRYYDPKIGRFLQEDPKAGIISRPQSLNLYPYVRNNPLNYIDPYGLYVAWVVKLLRNGGSKVIKTITSKAQAVSARLAELNVKYETRQAAHQAEKAAAKGAPIIKHKGHDLPNGEKGMHHYQTKGLKGHSFWAGAGAFLVDILDPFGAEALDDEEFSDEFSDEELNNSCPLPKN